MSEFCCHKLTLILGMHCTDCTFKLFSEQEKSENHVFC
uniref:Uncharacterized protein n=1 Tax=Arundo donax TaxID=35708 RepID=A0A0A8XXR6_ARUDO